MIGGEHTKERYSERLQRCQNQPKNRGYLPGTEVRTGGYTSPTLIGNWSEERADAAYYDGKATLATKEGKTWNTEYRHMTGPVRPNAPPAPMTTNGRELSQMNLIEVVDGAHRSYPKMQSRLMPDAADVEALTRTTVVQDTFRDPKDAQKEASQHVQPVLGGTPLAQATGVLRRLRHQLYQNLPGQSAFPGNVMRGVRHALQECVTRGAPVLNAAELRRGLGVSGVEASVPECVALVRSFDTVGNGSADVGVLGDRLRGELTDRRVELISRVYEMLTRLCEKGIVRLSWLVYLIDVGYLPKVQDGTYTAEEARAAFEVQWDARPDAYISQDKFSSFFSDASFEVERDQDFEIMMRNVWHLSGGTGKSANTSCRRLRVIHQNGRVTTEEVRNDLAIKDADGIDVDKAVRQALAAQGVTDVMKYEVLTS